MGNRYDITPEKITFHSPVVVRIFLFLVSLAFFALAYYCRPVDGNRLLMSVLATLISICLGLFYAAASYPCDGWIDLRRMSYEGFSLSLFGIRKVSLPRQELRSVIVLYSPRHNLHNIVLVGTRPVNRLAAIDNPDYICYNFLTTLTKRPEAERLAQTVADSLNLPYFGIQDRTRKRKR